MIKTLIIGLFTFFVVQNSFAQDELIMLDTLDFSNITILFEKYDTIGMHCVGKNEEPKHCKKEFKLFDNNIKDLQYEKENTLSFLNIPYEDISKEELQKDIYKDLKTYRYFIEYKPSLSKRGNSCFSNPGALIFSYILFDRLENKKYEIKLNYSMFICDIQILVNEINKNIKENKKK